jgi:hypothetical protein
MILCGDSKACHGRDKVRVGGMSYYFTRVQELVNTRPSIGP